MEGWGWEAPSVGMLPQWLLTNSLNEVFEKFYMYINKNDLIFISVFFNSYNVPIE